MPRNRNARQNRNTTRVVVQSTSGNQQAPTNQRARRMRRPTVNVNVTARPQQKRQRNNNNNMRMRINRRSRGRQQNAGQHEIHQRITTTLGTVGSNTSGGVENEMTVIINPSTMKEQTGSTSFGPLNVLASQYAMWRVDRIEVTLKQLVGNNAASGTVGRISAVPNTSASQVTWSSLGARRHTDVDIGKNGKFVITAKELKGPKDGWYYTNTTLDPCDACAGILQIHTLGRTMNPYQNQAYAGPLFLAEVTTDWSFKDYQQNPGMLNMVKSETSQNATIEVDPATNKILMKVANSSRLGSYGQNPSAAEVIWMVTDTVITSGADVFPAPFNWLFKGGWWIIKRLAGAPVANDTNSVYYEVFPSIADAQNNKPCYATGTSNSPVTLQQVDYQQITPSNLGTPGETLVAQASTEASEIIITKMEALYTASANNDYTPSIPTFFMKKTVPGPTAGIGVGDGTKIYTWNLHRVDIQGGVPTSGPPVYFNDNEEVACGYAVAANHVYFQGSGPGSANTPKDFRLTNVLFKATVDRAFTFSGNFGPYVEGYYNFNRNNPQFTVGSNDFTSLRLVIQAGRYYVAQFLCVGGYARNKVKTILGVSVYEPLDGWNNTAQTYSISPSVGDPTKGLPVSYCTPLIFRGQAVYEAYDDAVEYFAESADEEDGGDADDGDDDGLYFDEPPDSVLHIEPEVQGIYDMLVASGCPRRQAKLAVNQIKPSKSYSDFVATYHDSLVDGFSPASARAAALGHDCTVE